MTQAVIVAAIGAVSAILVAFIEYGRRENRRDHGLVADSLNRIEVKLDKHLDEHN